MTEQKPIYPGGKVSVRFITIEEQEREIEEQAAIRDALTAAAKPKRSDKEHEEQVKFFEHAAYLSGRYPDLPLLLYAVPNGGYRPDATASRMKAEGLKAGIPDINCDIPRGGYHGLRIEMKIGKKKPSPRQREVLNALNRNGYHAVVCYSEEEAINMLIAYLEGEIDV